MIEVQRLNAIPVAIGKEWMSLAYMQAICAQAGLNINKSVFDNGIDLEVGSNRAIGNLHIRNAYLSIQLKATENWEVDGEGCIIYDLPVKNYNQLRSNVSITHQYLVLFTMPSKTDSWVQYQFEDENHEHVIELRHMAYYLSLKGMPQKSNIASVRVKIPSINRLTTKKLLEMYKRYLNEQEYWINMSVSPKTGQ